ncbi:MAG TPA: cytochrome c-type biogenesis protein CcmH [Terriglobales bacterium]|nr:cytochrome c-type biogenesis protein CcmH [Terriglobales bacterium]
MKRLVHCLLLAAFCALLLGADFDKRFNDLGHKMMCKCGCNQVLLECNHVGCSYSERMRDELTTALQRGDSDDLVLQAFVQKYGATVLAAPTTTGFNRVAWIMPFAALGLGIFAVVYVVRLWKARQPATITSAAAAVELDEYRQRARQETEL